MSMTVYPRLYTSRRTDGEGIQVSQGDESVELLYKTLIDRNTNTRSWAFSRTVLTNAMRLFGDLQEWTREQLSNPNIVGYNREFIKDTLNFIQTGRREMPVLVWFDLVTEGGVGHHAHAIPQRLHESKPVLKASDDSIQLLQSWISQPNGLEDLLTTMHLLFGSARKPQP